MAVVDIALEIACVYGKGPDRSEPLSDDRPGLFPAEVRADGALPGWHHDLCRPGRYENAASQTEWPGRCGRRMDCACAQYYRPAQATVGRGVKSRLYEGEIRN